MFPKNLAFLFISSLVTHASCDLENRHVNVDYVSENIGAVFRYSNVMNLAGRQIFGRQENCGCQVGEQCCRSPENATFCIPESAICCGRGWCNGELEKCCLDGPHPGCCPKNSDCATGGKGCCKKDRPCFGPFICYDNQSEGCRTNAVDAFQCCPPSIPWCLFDPQNGYGCFPGKELPTYTTPVVSESTDVAQVPTTTSDVANALSNSTWGPTSSFPDEEPKGASTTVSTNSAPADGPYSPSIETGRSSITITRRSSTSEAPTPTDDTAVAAKIGHGFYYFKLVGIVGAALMVMA